MARALAWDARAKPFAVLYSRTGTPSVTVTVTYPLTLYPSKLGVDAAELGSANCTASGRLSTCR